MMKSFLVAIAVAQIFPFTAVMACSDADRNSLKKAGFGSCSIEQICTTQPAYMQSEVQVTPTQLPQVMSAMKAKGCENVAVIQGGQGGRMVASSSAPVSGGAAQNYLLVAKNCTLVARGYACPLGSDVQGAPEAVISDLQMDICAIKSSVKGSEQFSSFNP